MPYRALCYLITSCAGNLIAEFGDASGAKSLDLTNLCPLLAYHTEAMGSKQTCVLDLNNLSLIVRPFEGCIAAAIVPPDSQAAQAQFDMHLLAVLFQLGNLQSGSVQPGCANENLQHPGSNSTTALYTCLQRVISYQEYAMRGLSVTLQFPGVYCAELVAIDVHDKCFPVHSFPIDESFVRSHSCAFNVLQPAIHAACKSLHNVALPDSSRSPNSAASHCKRKNIQHVVTEPKTTFAAICLESDDQQALHWVAVVKCLHILDLHMFILAWSDVNLHCSSAQQGLAARPHVRIGKAAVQPDLRIKLNTAATIIRRGLYEQT